MNLRFFGGKILIKKKMIQYVIAISKKFKFAYNFKKIVNDAHKIIYHESNPEVSMVFFDMTDRPKSL